MPQPEPNVKKLKPAKQLVEIYLQRAVDMGASDIHFSPQGGRLRVQYRRDGQIIDQDFNVNPVPENSIKEVVGKLMTLAELDITKRFLPQDGSFSFTDETGKRYDIRIGVLPVVDGINPDGGKNHAQKITLRILNACDRPEKIEDLGFDEIASGSLRRMLEHENGIILTTGPTGSGKTTTLSTALQQIPDKNQKKIYTIEDPIEYRIKGADQAEVNERRGLTFAELFRQVLRQDPDVIFVGEIRDAETAEIAVRAAMTGHLVLSTLHTNTAMDTISRLIDLGVDPRLLKSTVRGMVSQRLVRKLCTDCRIDESRSSVVDKFVAPDDGEVTQKITHEKRACPGGCESCYRTGFSGRIPVVETLELTQFTPLGVFDGTITQREMMGLNSGEVDFRPLSDHARDLVRSGTTALSEVATFIDM